MSNVSAPVAAGDRIEVLDVLRGVAIFGILIANITVVSGYVFLGPLERAALATAAGDGIAEFAIHALIDAKFYSIFSLLFGFGFAMQMGRAEARGTAVSVAFPALFRRRLLGLLLIGFVHAAFIWAGDILLLYALLGLLLVPFHRVTDRTLLRAAAICLALPVVVYGAMLAAGAGDPFAPPPEPLPEGGQDYFALMMSGFREGKWLEAWRSNLIMLVGRWVDLFITVRFPKVFGMFLLGFYLGRRGTGTDLARDGALLHRVAFAGLAVGLPTNVVMAWYAAQGVYLPASSAGLAQVIAATIGVPCLALGYAASVVLAFHSRAGRRVLAPVGVVGRMALTNYLMHSVIMTALFYGWGLGWYGQVGPAVTTVLALGICLVQVPLSAAWLGRYQFGPVEWAWRRFTYRRPVGLRRGEVVASGSSGTA